MTIKLIKEITAEYLELNLAIYYDRFSQLCNQLLMYTNFALLTPYSV